MSQVDPEIKALQDSIFLSKVARARRTPINERLAAGPLLFDQCCRIMRDGIRGQFPDYTAEQVEREFQRRLAIGKKLSDGKIYRDAGMIDE
ncbi:MAG: hypothetical protein O3C40_17490 [Planctomycetota bacterium]|nr:hypothetical protein [Planctomycetota bacterium]